MQAIEGALTTLTTQLNPLLVDLTPEERQQGLKMGPRSSDFVARTLGYVRAMPEYLPGYVDVEEFQRDLDAMVTLQRLQHQLAKTTGMVEDSIMAAGGEAYAVALSIYASLKTAAQRGSPDATAAVGDLSARLGPRGRAKSTTNGAGTPAPVPVPSAPAPAPQVAPPPVSPAV
jgi:hypothetical protein